MSEQHIETLIIGAGQAGLSTGYQLSRLGREFLIVDGAERIGDNWRCQYDSLRLFTPAKQDGLVGMPFPAADPWHFPTKDEVADYLESYAVSFALPVRLGTFVERLSARPGGGYLASFGDSAISCDNVVVATGTFGRTPYVPDLAAGLDPAVVQMHSRDYRRPADLPDGKVLVVGASHSGCDLALELAASRPVVLSGPDNGELPIPWGSRRLKVALPFLRFAFTHVLTRRTPIGRKVMKHVRHHGAPRLRVKARDLDRAGVERTTSRVAGTTPEGLPVLDDGTVVDAASVLWCTGYQQRFGWIDLPLLVEDGWPEEYRGVVETHPGLFFCGLAFQYSFSSMEVGGVSRDAAYVADRIVERGERAHSVVAAGARPAA